MGRRILFSGFRDPSHSKSGGYDWITGYGKGSDTLLLSEVPFGHIPMKSGWIRIPLAILDIYTRFQRKKYDIVHLFYGDVTMLKFLPYRKSRRHKVVATVHLDIGMRKFKSSLVRQLRSLDKVIVLSSGQERELKEKYNIDAVFIPHGFNRPSFENVSVADRHGRHSDMEKINILTIGKMYRDFDLYSRMVTRLSSRDDMQFHLVGAPENVRQKYEDASNVSVYNRLDDNEFYSLISMSDYCFLPLSFATANNSLLESQSLDLTLILPRIDGVDDYAAGEPLNIFYSSEEELCEKLWGLKKTDKSGRLSKFVEKFEWQNIYRALDSLYDSLT